LLIYPNPFNKETNLTFTLIEDNFINISIYNILGEKVITLLNNFMKAGNYQIMSILLIFGGSFFKVGAQVFIADNHIMSYEVIVKFKKQIVNIPLGEKYGSVESFTGMASEIKNYLSQFNETIILEKIIPHAKPNDTLWINSKGETKKLNDWSQVFIIKFEYPKNLEEVIHRIKKMTEVEYVEAPVQLKYDETPNDLHYSGNQWYLTKIQAENAWNISKGNSAIRIAIVEGGGVSDHNDVNNKFISGEAGSNGDHGIKVAGVAALIFTCG